MRRPAAQRRPKPRVSRPYVFPAPTRGWIANENLADPTPGGAAMIVNWFVTATGVRMRRGAQAFAVLPPMPIRSMFGYLNGRSEFLFAAQDDAVYDVTFGTSPSFELVTEFYEIIVTEDGDSLGMLEVIGAPRVEGFAGGYWSTVQFATSGGVFLVGVNGENNGLIFDGSQFYPLGNQIVRRIDYDNATAGFTDGAIVTGAISGASAKIYRAVPNGTTGFLLVQEMSGTFLDNEGLSGSGGGAALVNGVPFTVVGALTGIAPARLSNIWVYKKRLWFIEKDSLDVWYLPVDQITGQAVKFPLGGVFGKGGRLLFGAAWSLDTGSAGGLSEQWVVFSSEGEVAVYQGTNPASAADWQLVGVYQIGRPMGADAWHKGGGDIIVATDIGFVPLSQAIQRDVAALSPAAVSYPIEEAWNERVAMLGGNPWHAAIWPTQQMSVISLPLLPGNEPEMLVANARTGAWSLYRGWAATCLRVFKERLFFGTESGRIMEAEVGGTDDGALYTATLIPLFSDCRSPFFKTGGMARAFLLANYPIEAQLSLQADFTIDLPPVPDAATIGNQPVWGGATWGESSWSAPAQKKPYQPWQSVSGQGHSFAPAIQITSGDVVPLSVDLVKIEVLFETSDAGTP